MLEIIPIILWAAVALFVWWLCGMIGLVFLQVYEAMKNKQRGYRKSKGF